MGKRERGRKAADTPLSRGEENTSPPQPQPQILNGSPDKTAIHGAWSPLPSECPRLAAAAGASPLAGEGEAGGAVAAGGQEESSSS